MPAQSAGLTKASWASATIGVCTSNAPIPLSLVPGAGSSAVASSAARGTSTVAFRGAQLVGSHAALAPTPALAMPAQGTGLPGAVPATFAGLCELQQTVAAAGTESPREHPRAIYFANFQRYVSEMLPPAVASVDKARTEVGSLESIPTTTMTDYVLKQSRLADCMATLESATGRLNWLRVANAVGKFRNRTPLAVVPNWSFAGNLKRVAASIQNFVSTCKVDSDDRGSKDH